VIHAHTVSGFSITKREDNDTVFLKAPTRALNVSRDGIMIPLRDLLKLVSDLRMSGATGSISHEKKEN